MLLVITLDIGPTMLAHDKRANSNMSVNVS